MQTMTVAAMVSIVMSIGSELPDGAAEAAGDDALNDCSEECSWAE
jgi:hypothetical protein